MTTKSKSPRIQQNYRLDAPTREALRIIGEIEKRSMGQIIELAVEEYYTRHYNIEFWEKRKASATRVTTPTDTHSNPSPP